MSIVWNFLRLYSLLEGMNIVSFKLMNVLLLATYTGQYWRYRICESQLELTAILRVRIECHRLCYVISRQSHVFACN